MHPGEVFKCSIVLRECEENNQKNNSKVSIFAQVLARPVLEEKDRTPNQEGVGPRGSPGSVDTAYTSR